MLRLCGKFEAGAPFVVGCWALHVQPRHVSCSPYATAACVSAKVGFKHHCFKHFCSSTPLRAMCKKELGSRCQSCCCKQLDDCFERAFVEALAEFVTEDTPGLNVIQDMPAASFVTRPSAFEFSNF